MTAGMSDQDAFDLVVGLHRLIRSLRYATLGAELPPAQLVVMAALYEHGPTRIGELAVRMHSSQPNATATVRNLELAGLVSREPDPEDRRAIRVTLTPEGNARILSVAHGEADVLRSRVAGLPESDQELLRSITPILRQLADPASAERRRAVPASEASLIRTVPAARQG